MSTENEREAATDDELDAETSASAEEASPPAEADANTPRNRAERRAAARAARRGRQAVLADPDAATTSGEVADGELNLAAPTTSMGGNPLAIPEAPGPKRPRVPPRTMSKGTGDVDGVPDWARRLGEGFSARRQAIVAGVIGALLIFGGVSGFQSWRARKAAEASDALTQAIDAFAAIPQLGDGAEPPRYGPSFANDTDRLRESATRFRRAADRFPDARTAPVARLALASTLYLQGRYDEARPLYQGLLGRDLAGMESQVLEGLGFTLESQGDLEGALARYRELQAVQDGAFRDQAQFYQARVHVRKNETEQAKELLRQIVERIGRAAASDPTVVPTMGLRDQAFALLREIAPTDPLILQRDRESAVSRPQAEDGDSHGTPGLPQGIPPELLRQIQEQMRRQKQGR